MENNSFNNTEYDTVPEGTYCVDFSFTDPRVGREIEKQDKDKLLLDFSGNWQVDCEIVSGDDGPMTNFYFRGYLTNKDNVTYYAPAAISLYTWLSSRHLDDVSPPVTSIRSRAIGQTITEITDIGFEIRQIIAEYEYSQHLSPDDFTEDV